MDPELKNLTDVTDEDSELKIYSYKSCNLESSEELKKIRGSIFDETKLISRSLGFTPEYNEEQVMNIPNLTNDTLSNYTFFKSEEGTLLRVFFYKKWYLSTHRKLDAFKSFWGSKESFGDIFLKCLEGSFEDLTMKLDTTNTYFFFIRNTKETRIVSNPPENYKMYHVCTLINNEKFDLNHSIGLPKQEKLEIPSLMELNTFVKMCDPFQSQGVIAFLNDGSGKHFKVVKTSYQSYVKIRNNEPELHVRFLELWVNNDESFKQFLDLYPEFVSKIPNYTLFIYKIAKNLHNMYFKKFVKKEKLVFQKDEWMILSNIHQWYWQERTSRKVTFDVVYKMLFEERNIRAFNRILKKLF